MSTAAVKAKAPKGELLAISKIAMRCGLDRATCKKRLDAHGYEPEVIKAKEKLYRFDAEMEADLTESQDKLTDVKIRKETAAAQIAELKVKQQMGDLIAVAEVEDYLQRLFKALYQEAVVRMPKRIAASVVKAKTAGEASEMLTVSIGKIFNTVREDHGSLLINGRRGK